MKKKLSIKIKKLLSYLFIMTILCCLSYILVYQASFLPNGYEIVKKQNDGLTIKSFNLIGKEKSIHTILFREEETWRVDDITYQVKRHKESLWLLFSTVSISSTLIVMHIRNGVKIWRAIF
ncbi:hypothetical protein [Psychrobacillus vulpis]|uniref:Uncharacterized protein n=1 Tax=Psychrobacillus vulpis TaxID=2325572 RepID=A0A544TPN0_9BACI|nr:hypothetical protein [Psychrobacillus vulpis]TQR19411.1 hypothetical protein FG384_12225 [Psychrobacillus vulpis]